MPVGVSGVAKVERPIFKAEAYKRQCSPLVLRSARVGFVEEVMVLRALRGIGGVSAEVEGLVYWCLVGVGSSKLLKGARRARISAQVLSWKVVRTQRTHERKKDYGREPWRARRTGYIV